jgi:integrase
MPTSEQELQEFLTALKPGSAAIYKVGLNHFQKFYAPQGTLKDFLDRVEEDQTKPRRERKRVARNVLREFMVHLQEQDFAPKSVRAYMGSVQSLAQYFEVPISLKHLDLPAALAQTKKYPWSLETVAKFINLFEDPMHKTTAVIFFQSGLGISDTLALTYEDIKREYESKTTPLCLDLSRIKTNTPFMSFIGTWAVDILTEYLKSKNWTPQERLFPVGEEAVEAYFRRMAKQFIGSYEGRNPAGPHSLRAGFRTILGDHKVDPLYIEFWMGHSAPEQQKVYVSKSRDGWRQTYKDLAEPWLTPRAIGIIAGSPEQPF